LIEASYINQLEIVGRWPYAGHVTLVQASAAAALAIVVDSILIKLITLVGHLLSSTIHSSIYSILSPFHNFSFILPVLGNFPATKTSIGNSMRNIGQSDV
jgi:hypothetical protein